ncbi:hypothetical protein BXZ70DRAFT_1007958 [Cristinia sonorae]|uniref:C3H1-type domain-containing protein n=1 Tax=Cristinia sonorae TaxID=1940300 RepID=A0A8K0UQH3_9AGAR|nr:hypothetical protein BXZ70DRAFT_1007958 [Cristinia sonorae]
MHDTLTKSPPPTNFYSHNVSDDKSSHTTKSSIAGPRDMSNRRAQQGQTNGAGRWRFNGTGQLVDSASSEWDLSDEIVKLQISGEGADANAQMRTPPQPKGNMGSVLAIHETSPLETASEVSADSSSPTTLDNFASHSRGSSADTTGSSNSQTLHPGPFNPLKVSNLNESRNRPHSYSGGLSAADLVRLQQAGGSPSASSNGQEPTYPSLTNGRTPDQSEEQRKYGTANPSQGGYPSNGRNAAAPNQSYRQVPPRAFNAPVQVPGVVPNPAGFGYPAAMHPGINSSQQQLYDMMLPTPPLDNPTMARLQQAYRPGHQHSASDPASLRDPATLALINSSMQAFAAGQMYPAMAAPPAMTMFANQFYGAPQDAYPSAELAMMARLQAQYSGSYGLPGPPQGVPLVASTTGSTVGGNGVGNGPSANNRKLGLYKTELCRSWEEKGSCRYGTKCQFAHGEEELRKVQRHPKYKTEICRTFWVSGSCPYGKRCCFIHTELPASGPPGADGTPPPPPTDGRARSSSTNSDSNEVPTSLLARISAKRTQEGSTGTNTSTTPPSAGGNGRAIPLRVDTSVIDSANASKQNKSAYPTFAHNGILMQAGEDAPARSPGPVTAAPDFGRHAAARLNIVGTQMSSSKPSNTVGRHSFSGSEDFSNGSTPTTSSNQASQQQQYGLSSPEQPRGSRINGHVRSGSAGNWGAQTNSRASHLTAYPLSSIPGGELKTNSPWADYGNRVVEKTWV